MAGGSRKPRAPVPANYGKLRLSREKVLRRIEAGQLRRGQHDAGAGAEGRSIYEARGLLALETR